MTRLRPTFALGALSALAAAALLAGCSRTAVVHSAPPAPIPTRMVTHVVTHDAKLIGSAVGGVRVTIREVATGRILAEGRHEGATGDTKRIMQEPHVRGEALFTSPDGARFEASIAVSTPTMVEVEAEGPLGYPDQMVRTTKRLVVVPGRDIGGDGIVLELHGYVIDVLAPDTTTTLAPTRSLAVRARVRMLCSCPTQTGGMWEVREVLARLLRDGVVVQQGPLAYAGETSTYAGQLPLPEGGTYVLEVLAATPERASFGVVRRRIAIAR